MDVFRVLPYGSSECYQLSAGEGKEASVLTPTFCRQEGRAHLPRFDGYARVP
jgi:hypothetical protein